jgi:hypothetical protein
MTLDRVRLTMAFLLAPAIPVLLAFFLVTATAGHPIEALYVPIFRFVLLAWLCVAYAATALIGVPAFFLIRRFRTVTGGVCILVGMMLGGIIALTIVIPAFIRLLTNPSFVRGDLTGWSARTLPGLLVGALFYGAIGGVAFWKLAGTSLSTTTARD